MFENVLFSINILQKSSWALGEEFLLVGVQGLVMSPGAGTLAAILMLTLLIFWKLCNYLKLSKPGFASSLSRKDETIVKKCFCPGKAGELAGFFRTLHTGCRGGNLLMPIGHFSLECTL